MYSREYLFLSLLHIVDLSQHSSAFDKLGKSNLKYTHKDREVSSNLVLDYFCYLTVSSYFCLLRACPISFLFSQTANVSDEGTGCCEGKEPIFLFIIQLNLEKYSLRVGIGWHPEDFFVQLNRKDSRENIKMN